MKRLIILLFISSFSFGQNTEKQKYPYIDYIHTDEGLFYSYENIFTNNESEDRIETFLKFYDYSVENGGMYISTGWCRVADKDNAKIHDIIAFSTYYTTYIYSFKNSKDYIDFEELVNTQPWDDLEIKNYKFMYQLDINIVDNKTYLKLDPENKLRIDTLDLSGYYPSFEIVKYKSNNFILSYKSLSERCVDCACGAGTDIGFIHIDSESNRHEIFIIETCFEISNSKEEKLNDNIVIYHCSTDYDDDYDVIIDFDKMSIEKKITNPKK